MRYLLLLSLYLLTTISGSGQKKAASEYLLNNPELKSSFIGICLYDPVKGHMIYQHKGHNYFTPASNTKLFSFYAGLKYLGDSTSGIQYQEYGDTLYIRGTGDPSFLHPDFEDQPVFDFLEKCSLPIAIVKTRNENKIYGPGWAWDDFNGSYQPERNAFPIYGNVVRFSLKNNLLKVMPSYFSTQQKLVFDPSIPVYNYRIKRDRLHNLFRYNIGPHSTSRIREVPFITFGDKLLFSLLADTLKKKVYHSDIRLPENGWNSIANVPADSLFKNMMYRSDNFYAEQTDAMVSMRLFGEIKTSKVIRYVLKHDLNDLPDKPRWVDGSGLSRYNLFSPADMITVLKHLYDEYGPEKIYKLLPGGGEGTLSNLYRDMRDAIHAKTGSLSNDVTLSGYLITQKGHTYFFSIMINHCTAPLNVGRKAMENFLRFIWKKY